MSRRSRVLFFMVMSMFLGYMPWYGFSAVLPQLVREFGLTPRQTGSILSVFQLGYVLTVIASGILADRFGNKRVLVGATLATGIFSTLFAFLSGGYASILVLRLLTGLSAGAIYAPGMALLSAWFPPEKRGMALGAYTAALTASYAGGYCIAGPLSAVVSWRWSIMAISLPVFAAALLLACCVKNAPNDNIPMPKTALAVREPLFPNGPRAPFLLTLGYFGHMWELYAFWGWVGPFLGACALSAGWSAPRAESFSGVASAGIILAGSLAVAGIGFLSDRLGRRKAILLAGTASAVAQFFFGFLHGGSMAGVLGIGSWIGFWCIADSAVYKASLCELVPPSRRATALGIQSAIGYTATVFSPLVFGWIMGLKIDGVSETVRWGLAFSSLGAGALLAPAALFFFPERQRLARQIACDRQAL